MTDDPSPILAQLDDLRTELADLAFTLERQGRLDAADVTNAIAGRLGEIRAARLVTVAEPDPAE